ncbi:signal transduction histidine kinase [Anaerotaenia torta]|uniref:sensor histidine kinase n=1 Tax=Anaerotaenia torta TaxID=433293 RepID=UPI003D240672
MDTKSKKFRIAAGFIAFFLGLSLLLGSMVDLAGGMLTGKGLRFRYSANSHGEIMGRDYQKTADFRQYVSDRLECFLGMATGAPVSTSGSFYWYNGTDTGVESFAEGEVSQDQEEGWGDFWRNFADMFKPKTASDENKKMAEKLHLYLQKDKNLLYAISYDAELLYSNGDRVMECAETEILPEGYNFMLYFNGRKVKLIKDGKEIDVYGDGYYRDSSEWYVPGYQNFPAGTGMEKARVCMLAAQTPVSYSYSEYGKSGYQQGQNELYWIWYNLRQEGKRFDRDRAALGIGVLLLLVYVFLRQNKREGDRILAGLMRRLWLEVKIIAAVFIAGIMLSHTGSLISVATINSITVPVQEVTTESASASSFTGMDDTWLEWTGEANVVQGETTAAEGGREAGRLLQNLAEILRSIFTEPVLVVLLFWMGYFAVLDVRRNWPVWKQSLLYKAMQRYRAEEMKLPLAKKLIRRGIIMTGACTLAVLAGITGWVLSGRSYGAGPVVLILCFLCLILGTQYFYLYESGRLAKDLDLLARRTASIRKGEYSGQGGFPKDSDLSAMAYDLEDIGQGMEKAVEEQVRSQRMKVELITNVSHDIKTPLTSIISYVQFLKKEEGLPEHVSDYIHILDEKSQRLKNMVQDVFDVSKAASGELPVHKEELDLGKLLRQTLADMEERIRSSPVKVRAEIPELPVMIEADGQKLYRVFQNLIQNALLYSLEGSRVYLIVRTEGGTAVASVQNTSRYELAADKDFAERFVRGDESRTDGGSGLGLSIARNFTEACGGSFQLETIADLFVVTVSFNMV